MSPVPPPAPPSPSAVPDPGHPSDAVLSDYATQRVGSAVAVAVELHLERCPGCRHAVNAAAAPERIEHNWTAIEAELAVPRRGIVERSLVRLGLSVDTTRLLLATPSLRRSWWLAIAACLLFGLGAADPDRPEASIQLFLVLAPVIPVVGVALAYGPGVDPAHEITVAAPLSGLRVVLTRSVTVLAVSIVVTTIAALALGEAYAARAAAWLVPAVVLAVVCLAVMTALAPRVAGAVVAGSWVVANLAAAGVADDELVLFGGAAQVVTALLGVAAAAVVVARRRRFDLAEVGP